MTWQTNPMSDSQGYLTEEQLTAIYDASLKRGYRDYIFILTLSKTGRRVSEIVRGKDNLGIRPMDINFDNNSIAYNILKKNPRKKTDLRPKPELKRIPISTNPGLIILLKELIKTEHIRPDGFLFDFTRQRAGQIIDEIARNAGVLKVGQRKLHPHTFRHTFAIRITRQETSKPEDLVMLQNLLMHSDIRITMNYLNYGQTRLKELIENI